METATTIDIKRARADTPAVEEKLHFNNAGASLMPNPVLDAVISHLQLEAKIGGYEAADKEVAAIEHVYDAVAKLINCDRDEVAIVENATRAWDMAFYAMQFKKGDRILTAGSEYVSNYIAFLQMKKKTGVDIEVIASDESGGIDLKALANSIDKNVKLIAITHVAQDDGLVNHVSQIGKIAKSAGIPFLLDACQSVGQMPLDVKEIGCDILSAAGRKFLRGPRGTGFLYVDKNMVNFLEPPFLDLHATEWISRDQYKIRPDARRFENWETNYACKIGLAKAIDYAMSWGLTEIEKRVTFLADQLRLALANIPGITVLDRGLKKCAIVTFAANNIAAAEISEKLSQKGINAAVSTRSESRLNLEARGLHELIRASVHYYNTEEEIERFCAAVEHIIKS